MYIIIRSNRFVVQICFEKHFSTILIGLLDSHHFSYFSSFFPVHSFILSVKFSLKCRDRTIFHCIIHKIIEPNGMIQNNKRFWMNNHLCNSFSMFVCIISKWNYFLKYTAKMLKPSILSFLIRSERKIFPNQFIKFICNLTRMSENIMTKTLPSHMIVNIMFVMKILFVYENLKKKKEKNNYI